MSSGYLRQAAANISSGLIINADDFNAEYNQIQAAFDGTSGHDHTGGVGLGPKIGLTNAVTGILPSANGGTGSAFIAFAGPTALRTYTLPNSNATLLTTASTLGVANGGTGLTAGTSGGLLYFSGAGTIASSAALAANQILLGAGAGLPPTSLSLGTSTTVLHGNAGGAPTWGAVSLTTDITGTLPIANGGTGQVTANAAFNAFAPSQATNSGKYLTTDGTNTSWVTISAPAAGFADPGGNGIVVRTALNTSTNRTITGTAGTITVTNGDGVSGNPTLTISASYVGQNTITTLGTITTGTWTGTSIAVANGGTGATTAATARTNLGAAALSVAQSFTGGQRASVTALTSSGASIATDLSLNNNYSHTFTENTTLANPTNATAGQSGAIMLTQHASSPKTLAFGSNWKFANGTVPTVSATNSAQDTLFYNVRSSTFIEANLVTGWA